MNDVDVFPSDTSWLSEPTTGVHQFGGGSQDRKEMREVTEDYWCRLSLFQLGVGGVPISFEISNDNPTVKEWYERQARVDKWLKLAMAEREEYENDIEHFARSERGRAG